MKLTSVLSLLALSASLALLSACGGGESAVAKGDPVRGKELYKQCSGCHQLQANSTGPKHCGLIGRPAASVLDFEYSQAMRDSGLVWNPTTLDEFLTSPISYVPGTMMGFAGFPDAADRADVIAYLQQANNDPSVCGQ
jgi:cytochrome c